MVAGPQSHEWCQKCGSRMPLGSQLASVLVCGDLLEESGQRWAHLPATAPGDISPVSLRFAEALPTGMPVGQGRPWSLERK